MAEKLRRHVVSSGIGERSRRDRRGRRRQERALINEAYRAEAEEQKRVARAETAAWRSPDFLPAAGEEGAHALRNRRLFRSPKHRTNTGLLALAYPFLADPGLGTQGIMMGRNLLGGSAFVYDPFVLYKLGILSDPNIIIAGKVGLGKSTLIKCLTSRGSSFGYRSYVPADVKGEWTEPALAMGGKAFVIGPGMATRLNLLARPLRRPAGMSAEAWEITSRNRRSALLEAIAEPLMGRLFAAEERSALGYALDQVLRREAIEPTLGELVHELYYPEKDAHGRVPDGFRDLDELQDQSRRVGHGLARLTRGALSGIVDGKSTVQFDTTAPMVTVDVSRLQGNELLDVLMTCTSSWMESSLQDGTDDRRFMVYDEAWRVVGRPQLLRRLQHDWKVARNWGISNIMAIHGFGDLETAGAGADAAMANNLVSDSSTVISFRQTGKAVEKAQGMLDLTDTASSLLRDLRKGQSLWRIGQAMSLVQITRTPREAARFDTDERMNGEGSDVAA
jgi:type IV secretory pathway VirB4 component